MAYEDTHDTGRKPFCPDSKRGYWASSVDFLYACWGQAFNLDMISLSWFFFFEMGIMAIIPYIICMAVYVVPIMAIKLFMGQFSSSGFISAFRIAPLFKGMGYISLAVNFSILTYYSIIGAVPLFYTLHSLRPTLPWSCEAVKEWTITKHHICNITHENNKINMSSEELADDSYERNSYGINHEYKTYHIPSVMFSRAFFSEGDYYDQKMGRVENFMSWELFVCMILVWTSVALVFYKAISIDRIGIFLRYTMWILLTLLLLCTGRIAFLPGAMEALKKYFMPNLKEFSIGLKSVPAFAVSSFGMGWGLHISMASHNKFRTNILRYSWFVCLGHFAIMILLGLMNFMVVNHFSFITDNRYLSYIENHWSIYLSFGSAMAGMEWPNMWSVFFYGMQFLASVFVIVTQLTSILTALFDEFESLRNRKQEVTFTMIGALVLCSIYFCTSNGAIYYTALSADAFFSQTVLNLLLLLVVLWVYGRMRFQRDIEFMLGQRFATWRVYMLRFVAPIALFIIMFISGQMALIEHLYSSIVVAVVGIVLIAIPWLFIPGYAVFGLLQTSGSFSMRFKRCCQPTDWNPVEAEERERYDDNMSNLDPTQQLTDVLGEVN